MLGVHQVDRTSALPFRACSRMNAGIPSIAAAQGQRVDIHCFSTWPRLQDNLSEVARLGQL